jgi:integrase
MTQHRRGHGEGSIYRQSDGRWSAAITLENRKRKVLYGKTRREVQDKLKQALHEQQQGTLITTPQQTVAHFLQDWLENSQKQSLRPRSYERYEEMVRLHIIPGLGRHQLLKLTGQHLQAFYTKKVKEGLSPTTVIGLHNVLHKALDTAVKWNLVARNVCDVVDPPRKIRHEIQPLMLEQVKKLLEVARSHPYEALYVLALATGMRRGELLGLKWQDINFATGTLQVQRILSRVPRTMRSENGETYEEAEPKTQKSRRSVTIAAFAIEALKHHRERQLQAKAQAGHDWQEQGYVFCTSIGTHLLPNDVLEQLKILLKKAGLPAIRFHDLRHSAATLLFSQGVHPKVVQELLGHSDISMTMDIYSHMLPTMQQEAMNKLNEALLQ